MALVELQVHGGDFVRLGARTDFAALNLTEDTRQFSLRSGVASIRIRRLSDYEIVVVNDNSKDRTEELLHELARRYSTVRYVNNLPPNGFGLAVRKGLEVYRGEVVCVVMADLSDSPKDIVMYYQKSL